MAHIAISHAGECAAQGAGGFDGAKAEQAEIAAGITTITGAAIKRLRAIFHHKNFRMMPGDFKNRLHVHARAEEMSQEHQSRAGGDGILQFVGEDFHRGKIHIHRHHLQPVMLEDAGHVGNVDAANDDLAAARKMLRGQPTIKGGADGKRGHRIVIIGPKRFKPCLKALPTQARPKAVAQGRNQVAVPDVDLFASVHQKPAGQRGAVLFS